MSHNWLGIFEPLMGGKGCLSARPATATAVFRATRYSRFFGSPIAALPCPTPGSPPFFLLPGCCRSNHNCQSDYHAGSWDFYADLADVTWMLTAQESSLG